MSKLLEIEYRARPCLIMFFVFVALLKVFSTQDVTYPLAYQISNIGTSVFGIPYCVLQFQQKKKPLIENLFHIALGPAILFKWI